MTFKHYYNDSFSSEPSKLVLRELECWAIIDGREVQLDTNYYPNPEKPEWVKQLKKMFTA